MDGKPVTFAEFQELLRITRDKTGTTIEQRVNAALDYEEERKSALRRVNGFVSMFRAQHTGPNPLILSVRIPGRPEARLHLNDLLMVIHEQTRRADF